MDINYVYLHKDPTTKEVLYVGSGSFERAWLCRGSNRSKEHKNRLEQLFDSGYTMQDIVKILDVNLTKQNAVSKEFSLIQKYQPIFNRHGKADWKYPKRKFTDDVCDMITALKEMKYGCQNIAFLLGGDKKKNAMSIWRNSK